MSSHFHGYRQPTRPREIMSVRRRILGPPVPKMPPGLIELMDGLARDVLKNNPENIYEFCAHHMHTLLEIRDGSAPKPLLTLDQKIAKAQKKVKQRAEQRQREYDTKLYGDINKRQDTPCSEDNTEIISQEKGIENIPTDVDADEKEEINFQDVQKIENPPQLIFSEVNTDTSDEVIVNIVKEDKDHENNSENCIVIIENEKYSMLKNEHEDIEGPLDNIGNNVSDEVQSIAIPSDITEADKDTVSEPLMDELVMKLEINDNTGENIVSLGKDIDTKLQNEDIDDIKNESGIKIQKEIENNTVNEITSSSIEKIDITPQGDSHFKINAEQFEKHIDVATNTLNKVSGVPNLHNETKSIVLEKQAEHLNETDESHDDKILAVILSSENTELTSLQCNEPATVQPHELDSVQIIEPESLQNNGVDQKTEDHLDIETGPESTHDKTNNINSSMDLETAAITIQKVFRSFLFKTKTASYDDPTTVDLSLLTEDKEKEENEVVNVKDRRPLGISRMDTVLQTVNEEKSLSLSTDDSSTLSSAATIIQAHVRGFLVRNKFNLNKTISSNSLIDSDVPSIPSLEVDSDNRKSKTVLNIHIVPEGSHFVSRDESILTSMDLSLDSSPPSSVNLHPLGYDKSERRKQLKREDAIQSVSPPSNNSGKLSEDHDSVKEVLTIDIGQVVEDQDILPNADAKVITQIDAINENPTTDAASDELDVITPFAEDRGSRESDNSSKLLHSGEFHDIVVPTNVSRSDTSVVREFQNVLVYFILWNN